MAKMHERLALFSAFMVAQQAREKKNQKPEKEKRQEKTRKTSAETSGSGYSTQPSSPGSTVSITPQDTEDEDRLRKELAGYLVESPRRRRRRRRSKTRSRKDSKREQKENACTPVHSEEAEDLVNSAAPEKQSTTSGILKRRLSEQKHPVEIESSTKRKKVQISDKVDIAPGEGEAAKGSSEVAQTHVLPNQLEPDAKGKNQLPMVTDQEVVPKQEEEEVRN